MNRHTVLDCMKALLAHARRVSPSQALFGEEPWLVLLVVAAGGFVFYPLFEDEWPWLLAVVAAAGMAHVWLWCREARLRDPGDNDREAR